MTTMARTIRWYLFSLSVCCYKTLGFRGWFTSCTFCELWRNQWTLCFFSNKINIIFCSLAHTDYQQNQLLLLGKIKMHLSVYMTQAYRVDLLGVPRVLGLQPSYHNEETVRISTVKTKQAPSSPILTTARNTKSKHFSHHHHHKVIY